MLGPFKIRVQLTTHHSQPEAMLKHYIKIALRNLVKQKGLTVINILGLSIGLACFILFLLYSVNEFTFDRFHKNANQVYRVYSWWEPMNGQDADGDTYMPMPLGAAMKQDLPDVENYVRLRENWGENFVRAENKVTRIGVTFADPQFFSVFSFKLKSGDPNTALKDFRNIVLTEKIAKRLFGNSDPIGKTVEIKLEDKFEPLIVSAVAEDIPANSTITFDILGNFLFYETTASGKWGVNNWNRSAHPTFVQLRKGSQLPDNAQLLATFRKKYYPDEEVEMRKAGWTGKGMPVRFGLQPILDMHTSTKIYGGSVEPVKPKNIWILLGIAMGVLLIACINFTTLAIGRSAGRAKEVGIRKVVGSRKKDLVMQFMMEALLLTVLSMGLGLLIGRFLLPWFNQLSGRELSFSFEYYPEMIWLIVALMLFVGLLAGSYPSLVLSRFNPIEVLKRKMKIGGSNLFTRSLVTLQFTLSAALLISTIIMIQQLNFMRSKNPGFNKENIIVVHADGTETKQVFPLFKQELSKNPLIKGIAGSELGLGEGTGWNRSGFEYNGKHKDVYEYFIDPDYLNVMGIQLLAGRNFDPKISSDTVTSVIINESMVKNFGWTVETAVGQPLTGYMEKLTPVVIGVVKNFNFRPFSEAVLPQLFHQFSSYKPFKFFVRIKEGNPSKAIASLQTAWKKVVPDLPFKYSFLDEDLNRFYKAETRWSNIVGWAGGLSIFLACLGLLGLAALAAVNRTKEIGIRKVLGASLSGIVGLLSKDFLKLVVIAFIIAAPLAWYFMHKWLQDFEYRISIGWPVFLITAIVAILIAFITISSQALKAALSNPVKSLRTE
jgi:putative ABC transport system permease protein